jgi:hypothetical protein
MAGETDQQMLSAALNMVRVLSQVAANIARVFPTVSTTQTTVGAAGGATALPATPLGYMRTTLPNGSVVAVPYYSAS